MKKYEQVTCGNCGQNRRVVRGEWLRWKRERLGISMRYMARWLDFSPAYISDVENGNRKGTVQIWEAYEQLGLRDSDRDIGRPRQ